MADTKTNSNSRHTLIMTEREHISITGIVDVISFDEEMILAETDMGVLILKGSNLHVNRLSLEKGDLDIEGHIDSLNYEEQHSMSKNRASLLSKLFK